MDTTGWAILSVILVILLGLLGWWYMRHRYVKNLEAKGWSWERHPGYEVVAGLNVAPFGVGFERSVDSLVTGQSSTGVPFRAFRYRAPGFKGGDFVVAMPLPKSLPMLAAFPPSRPREGLTGISLLADPVQVVAADAESGPAIWQALQPALTQPLLDSHQQRLAVDISVDHAHLVFLWAPRDADSLASVVEWLAGAHRTLTSSAAMRFEGPPPPPFMAFTNHPTWQYIPRDDSFLNHVSHDQGGHSHEAHDIVVSDNFGIPFIRLTHRWKTTHTRTDSKGNTQTYTQNHSEDLCEFRAPFTAPALSFNMGWFRGQRVQFESAEFNRRYKVATKGPARFAYDVCHPRMMEYLMRNPTSFALQDNQLVVKGGDWSLGEIEHTDRFLRGFLGRIPDFVYQELGAWPRPIPEVENYNS